MEIAGGYAWESLALDNTAKYMVLLCPIIYCVEENTWELLQCWSAFVRRVGRDMMVPTYIRV